MSDYPPTQPTSRLGGVLETLAPAILAAVAAKQGGPRAAGAVLQTTNQFAAQDQADQERQAQIAETHRQVEQQRLDRAAQESQAQKQQAATFRVQAMNTLRQITDPTEWTSTANQLDDIYSQTFGAPAGTIKAGLSFSDAGALKGDQKLAGDTLTALEKRYGKSELWDMNPTVQFKGKPTKYRDLVQMAGLQASTATSPENPSTFGMRADGTPKGNGYLGVLPRTDGSGKVSSEISIGVNIDGKEVQIPTMVPTLTPDEKNWLLSNDISNPSKIPQPIIRKATAYARQRIAAGQSPFAQSTESPAPSDGLMAPQRPPDPEAKTQGSFDAQFNDVLSAQEQKLGRKLNASERAALRLSAKKAYDAANDRPGLGGPNGALDEGGLDYAATAYRVTGVMPALGIGNGPARAAIVNRTAAQAKALGQSPAAAIQKQAAYKSDAASLTQMRKMSSSAEAFENKALQQADIVANLSDKVSRTQWPIINRALLAGEKEILGDTNTQLLFNAVSTFTTEYAKIMEGSTGSVSASSESARRAAERLISAKLNKGTLQATLDLMKKEMGFTVDGYNAVIDQITTRMGGMPQAPVQQPPPAAPSAVPSYQEYLRSKGAH